MNNFPLKITQLIVSLVVMIVAIVFNFWKLPAWLAWISLFLLWSCFIAPWAWFDKCFDKKRPVEISWLLGQAAWALPVTWHVMSRYSESGYLGVMLVVIVSAIGLQGKLIDSFLKLERT